MLYIDLFPSTKLYFLLIQTGRQYLSPETTLKDSPLHSTQNRPALETVGNLPGYQRAPFVGGMECSP